jgi:uncharacterized protein YqhQ
LSIRDFLRISAHIQMLPVLESGEETLVGGQAVMEGVMMRAPHSYCVAVRKADGQIITDQSPLPRVSEKYPIFKLPVLRGLGTLGQAMGLGFKALRFSAEAAIADFRTAEGKSGRPVKEMPPWMMWVNLAFSLVFFLVLYKAIPLYLAMRVGSLVPAMQGRLAVNIADGLIRLAFLILFLALISRMKDMHRVFQYHGAEHKVVFNYESGQPVTVENAQTFVTWHPRCGTSFLIVVMLISLAAYAFLPIDGYLPRLLARIALLPLIVGVSYEVIRFAARRRGSFLAMLTSPGLWLQRITTQPPTDEQAAVAIHALDGAMALEARQGGELVIA